MAYNEALANRMRTYLKAKRGIAEKKMFGGVGFLVNGNMACGVNQRDLIVRLGEEDFEKALKQPGVRVFDMTGRPMKGWIMVKPEGCASEQALQGWIEKGLSYAKTLPAK